MTLPKKEVKLFFNLYIPLLGYANQYDGKGARRPLDKARKILYNNPKIIRDFISSNPEKFNKEKIEIVKNWQNFVKGDFILIRSFKKYDIFLSLGRDKPMAYGVLGLTDSPIDMVPYGVGTYLGDVILFPWRNQIIWDGLVYFKPLIIGNNYMRGFTQEFEEIKQKGKIIERFD